MPSGWSRARRVVTNGDIFLESFHTPGASGGIEHTDGAPSPHRLAVAPALDVAVHRVRATGAALGRIRGTQRAPYGIGEPGRRHGERLLQSLSQARRAGRAPSAAPGRGEQENVGLRSAAGREASDARQQRENCTISAPCGASLRNIVLHSHVHSEPPLTALKLSNVAGDVIMSVVPTTAGGKRTEMTRSERITYTIKVTLAHVLYYTGLLRIWQLVVLRRKAVVLMYHRVLSLEERSVTGSHPGIIVDETTFAEQMAFLRRRFCVLSLDEFTDRLARGIPFQNSSCVITFDDGWRDNFENALPPLLRHELPAVVFLPVNYIGHNRQFWQEALTNLLWQAAEIVRAAPRRRERFENLLSPIGLSRVLGEQGQDLRASIREIVGTTKELDMSVIEQMLSGLASELGIDLAGASRTDGFMTWDEIREMSRHDVAFGGHGADHRILTRLPSQEAEAEIWASKAVIDSRLSQNTVAFAYPNGDWNACVADEVRKGGFSLAFTTERGFVTCNDDRFSLRRVNVHEDMTRTIPMFLAHVTGLL
jgi:peptidoglycan/xylan/chitin deacetylase (PgdA/CDA1 family)